MLEKVAKKAKSTKQVPFIPTEKTHIELIKLKFIPLLIAL